MRSALWITITSAYLTLVDLTLLITSPRDYFLGGIGDTLAK
ncbi:iron-containing alcohol dehydrogenase family protein [Sodalis glossinidius]|nr:iron-containing alcohol dehydrogenase family protein [Sodalis glossinidius]